MRRIKLKRPSPGFALAVAALIIATSGSSFATAKALLGGEDVRNDSLTGADIRESTLGTVPKAAKLAGADTADLVTRAQLRAKTRAVTQGLFGPRAIQLSLGDEEFLGQIGPIRLHAKCDQAPGTNNERFRIIVESTTPGTYMAAGPSDQDAFGPGFGSVRIDPDTQEVRRTLVGATNASPGKDGVVNQILGGWVLARDGTYVGYPGESVVVGFNEFGSRCFMFGRFLIDDFQ